MGSPLPSLPLSHPTAFHALSDHSRSFLTGLSRSHSEPADPSARSRYLPRHSQTPPWAGPPPPPPRLPSLWAVPLTSGLCTEQGITGLDFPSLRGAQLLLPQKAFHLPRITPTRSLPGSRFRSVSVNTGLWSRGQPGVRRRHTAPASRPTRPSLGRCAPSCASAPA